LRYAEHRTAGFESMTQTITTTLRLADDSTAPITIRRRAGCSQWSAVTIDDKPVKHCKRGHVLIGQAAAKDRNGHLVCKVCKRERDRRWYETHREQKKRTVRIYHRTVRKPRERQRRKQNSVLTLQARL
jgi:hypothetical protein